MISLEKEKVPHREPGDVSPPLRIKCKHQTADRKTGARPLLAFPSTTLPTGPAPQGLPADLSVPIPSSEPLCLLLSYADVGKADFSLFSHRSTFPLLGDFDLG